MSSKVFLLLALVAIVLFLSSDVVARDLAKTEATTQVTDVTEATTIETNGVYDAKYGGYGGGRYDDASYRRRCPYGICCRNRRCRCCAYAGEATEAKPKN